MSVASFRKVIRFELLVD